MTDGLRTGRRRSVVTVNGRFLTRQSTGVDRFAAEILGAWLPLYGEARDAKIVVPTGAKTPVEYVPPPRARGRFSGHAWEQLELPTYDPEDVLLSLCNTGPILRRRQLVVLHDAAVMANPSAYSVAFRTWYRALFKGLMHRAAVVASVSKFSAVELSRYFGGKASDIEVVYESGEHVLRSTSETHVLERLGLAGSPYVLAVGSRSLNKNFAGVVKAAERLTDLGVKVVAAGGGNSRVFSGAKVHDDSLVLAGYVSDGELRALYENAQCFVYPSFYEGFGLPPLEAMHCGCPVIVSNRASLPEVCAAAAIYCDPDDPADIADALRRVLTSAALRNEMREAGLQRAALFTWRKSADRLEDILISRFDATP